MFICSLHFLRQLSKKRLSKCYRSLFARSCDSPFVRAVGSKRVKSTWSPRNGWLRFFGFGVELRAKTVHELAPW